jgi:signal peptidase II
VTIKELNQPENKTRPSLAHTVGAYLSLAAIAGLVIWLDQLTKDWVRSHLALGETWRPFDWLPSYVRIVNWRNSGSAFGLFQGGGGIFAILAVIVTLMIIFYFPRIQRGDWALRAAMGLQLGGAVGNLLDRLQHNLMVTDFVSVGSFPVFNVADTAITFGVIILFFSIWLGKDSEPEHKAELGKEHAASE